MLGTIISPYLAISDNEAQHLLDISIREYLDARAQGYLKRSVKICTAVNNHMIFSSFWDLLEFAIQQRVMLSNPSLCKDLSERIVDEIARYFDQRNQDAFDLRPFDVSQIVAFEISVNSQYTGSEDALLRPIVNAVLISFKSLVLKCDYVYSNNIRISEMVLSDYALRHQGSKAIHRVNPRW